MACNKTFIQIKKKKSNVVQNYGYGYFKVDLIVYSKKNKRQ